MDADQNSREQHKPLTAAEIEALRRKWAQVNTERETMTPEEIRALTDEVIDTYPRLLSMLQPPTDAAVREAMEYLERSKGFYSRAEHLSVFVQSIDTLLSHVRAVQSPRLTGERLEAVRFASTNAESEPLRSMAMLRAAFSGVFGQEG